MSQARTYRPCPEDAAKMTPRFVPDGVGFFNPHLDAKDYGTGT